MSSNPREMNYDACCYRESAKDIVYSNDINIIYIISDLPTYLILGVGGTSEGTRLPFLIGKLVVLFILNKVKFWSKVFNEKNPITRSPPPPTPLPDLKTDCKNQYKLKTSRQHTNEIGNRCILALMFYILFLIIELGMKSTQ